MMVAEAGQTRVRLTGSSAMPSTLTKRSGHPGLAGEEPLRLYAAVKKGGESNKVRSRLLVGVNQCLGEWLEAQMFRPKPFTVTLSGHPGASGEQANLTIVLRDIRSHAEL